MYTVYKERENGRNTRNKGKMGVMYDHFWGCSLRCCWIKLCYTDRCFCYFVPPIYINEGRLNTINRCAIVALKTLTYPKKCLHLVFLAAEFLINSVNQSAVCHLSPEGDRTVFLLWHDPGPLWPSERKQCPPQCLRSVYGSSALVLTVAVVSSVASRTVSAV